MCLCCCTHTTYIYYILYTVRLEVIQWWSLLRWQALPAQSTKKQQTVVWWKKMSMLMWWTQSQNHQNLGFHKPSDPSADDRCINYWASNIMAAQNAVKDKCSGSFGTPSLSRTHVIHTIRPLQLRVRTWTDATQGVRIAAHGQMGKIEQSCTVLWRCVRHVEIWMPQHSAWASNHH